MRAEEILQHNASILTVYCDTNLLEMLMLFQANSTRVALVCKAKKKVNPDIASIMYSVCCVLLQKTDMIMKDKADIIGMVFLSQLFAEMAKFK